MQIDIQDFITKEQKEIIEQKITKAISLLDSEKIAKVLEKSLLSSMHNCGEYILDDVDFKVITKAINKKLKETVSSVLSK